MVAGAQAHALDDALALGQRGQEYDGDFGATGMVEADFIEQPEAVHAGHGDVGQGQAGLAPDGKDKRRFAVRRLYQLVARVRTLC